MNSSIYFIGGAIVYIILSLLFKKVFYRGRVGEGNCIVFNLSLYAEIALIILFLAVGFFEIINLYYSMPIWYNWIFPIFWLLYFFVKAFFVFVNRNNSFIFNGNKLQYSVGNERGEVEIVSYRFRQRKSEAPSFSRSGWFLKIWISEDEADNIEFDLKNLNLEGFKEPMEEYLRNLNIANKE